MLRTVYDVLILLPFFKENSKFSRFVIIFHCLLVIMYFYTLVYQFYRLTYSAFFHFSYCNQLLICCLIKYFLRHFGLLGVFNFTWKHMLQLFLWSSILVLCDVLMIWYHLYNLKNVKNTHGGVLLLVKWHSSIGVFYVLNCANDTKLRNASHISLAFIEYPITFSLP